MKARTAVTIALIAVATVASVGTVRNVVRRSTDKDAAAAAAAGTLELSRAATRDEAVWTNEIDRLREALADLEQQIFADDPDVAEAGADLSQSAGQFGLTVTRLDSDPTRGIVSVTACGPETAAVRWLQTVEQAMSRDGGLLEQLIVTAGSSEEMTIAIDIRYVRSGKNVPNPEGPSRTELLEAAESWPTADVHAVSAAFHGWPADLPAAEALPFGDEAITAAGRVELIGIASINGVTHYALRFAEEKSIRTLEVGQQAFGWNLIEAGEPSLVLQKEGQHYAIPR